MKRLKIYLLAGTLLSPLSLFAQTGNDQIPTVSSEALINLQQHSVANQEMNGTDETDVDSKEAQKRKAEAEKAQKKAEKERQKAQKEAEKAQKKAEKEAQKAAEKEQKEAEKEAQRLRKEAEKAQKEAEKAREKAEAAQAKADAAQAKADEEASAPQKQKAGEDAAKGGGMASEPSVKTNPSGQPEAATTNENTESVARADEQHGNPKKMQKQHEKNAKEIDRLLSQITQHEDAPAYLLMMADHIEENWIAKPFSRYSPAKLEMAIRAYERVAEQCDRQDDRQKLQQAAKRLNGLYKDAQLYWEVSEAISSPYDKKVVAPLIPQMQKLRDGVNQNKYPDKCQDLKDLTRQLYFYDAKVDIFKDLIDAFDNALKDAQNVKGTLSQLRNEYQEDIEAIVENPWLGGQFEEYIKNPLQSPVRATIKGLITE